MIILFVIPLSSLGIFIIVGCYKNIDYLVSYKSYGMFSFPYNLLNKLGDNAIKIYHYIVGVGMLFVSYKLLFYFIE